MATLPNGHCRPVERGEVVREQRGAEGPLTSIEPDRAATPSSVAYEPRTLDRELRDGSAVEAPASERKVAAKQTVPDLESRATSAEDATAEVHRTVSLDDATRQHRRPERDLDAPAFHRDPVEDSQALKEDLLVGADGDTHDGVATISP